jgi:hypothetical protein
LRQIDHFIERLWGLMLTTPLTLLPNATLETGSASDRQPCQTTPLPPPPPPSSPKVCISQETPRKVFAHIASRYISEGLSLLGDQDQQHEGDSEDSESEFIEALKEVPWEPLKGMDQGDEEAEVGNIGSVDGRRLTSGLQLYPDFVAALRRILRLPVVDDVIGNGPADNRRFLDAGSGDTGSGDASPPPPSPHVFATKAELLVARNAW